MANHDEGASPTEVLLGAARINNLDLLKECLAGNSDSATLLNSTDSMGNSALHNAAKNGCLECLDYLLDQEGIDLDLRNRMDGDTPLHLAVRYSKTDREASLEIVEFLIDAGADTQVRNKHNDMPVDLVGESDQGMKDALMKADLADMMTGDVVDLDDLDEDAISVASD